MTITQFQTDLQKGISINEALKKHGLTLPEAMYELKKQGRPNKKRIPKPLGMEYISRNQGKYLVRKTINGKMLYFGRYATLEDAMKIRDYFAENGWQKEELQTIRGLLKV